MTLALYGKSRGRKTLLILAALLSVLVAMAGGATLRNSEDAAGAAAPKITAKTHQGQEFPGLTYTSGNVTTYKEGDSIQFRFTLTGDASTTGTLEVRFSENDGTCVFFDGSFVLGAITNVSGTLPSVTPTGAPTASGGEWVQPLSITFSAAGEAIVNYTLRLSQQAGQCNGSSQHSRLNPASGAVEQTGQQNVPVPANQVIELPDITAIKKIDRDGDGTFESTALAGEYCFRLDSGTCVNTNASGQVVFTNVTPDGAHAVTEQQVSFTQGTYQFASGAGTNCTFTGSTATATVAAGTTPTNATCTFNNTSLPDLTVSKSAVAPAGGFQIGVPFKWQWIITNAGATPATFPINAVILGDTLPAGATYANPLVTAGITTNVSCSLPTATTIQCKASPAAYTIAAGASLTITVDATPAGAGTLNNTDQVCVDPGTAVAETNDNNNNCSATATIANDPTLLKVADNTSATTTSARWNITVDNNVANAVTQTVKVKDAGVTFLQEAPDICTSLAPGEADALECVIPAGTTLVIPVSKTVIATCLGGTATNTVDLFIKKAGAYPAQPSATVSNVSATFPGDRGLCTRTITVCKAVTSVDQGITASGTFDFGGSPSDLGVPAAFTLGPVAEGATLCTTTPFTVLSKDNVTITESAEAGFNLAGWSRTDNNGTTTGATASVTTGTGNGNVTITFTNIPQSRQITVCKVVADNLDGVQDSGTFTFDSTHNGVGTDATIAQSENGGPACQTFTAPITGFNIGETLPDSTWTETGWVITGGANSTGAATIPAGSTALTVTFTNVKATRTIQVCKIVEENNDELADQGGTFSFTAVGTTNSIPGVPATEGQGSQCRDAIIAPLSEVTVTESGLPGGFINASGYPKYQVNGGEVTGGSSAVVAAGSSNVVVTFTNKAPTGTLTINKTVIPAADSGKFDLDRDGDTHEATNQGNNGTTGPMTVSASTHSVSEFAGTGTNLADYTTSVVCTGDNPQSVTTRSVTVAEGANVVCTFTNTRKPKLTVVKDLNPANDNGRFDLVNGGTTYTGPGGAGYGDGGTTGAHYAAIGSNTFGEAAHSGTSLSDYVTTAECRTVAGAPFANFTFTNPTGTVTLAAGDDVICTIKNERKAKITITKVTLPASDPQDFTFSATGPNYTPPTITLDTDTGSGTPASETLSGLAPNTYSLVETSIPSGWLLTGISCTTSAISYGTGTASFQGLANVSVTVAPGDDVTCTFTNTKQAKIIVRKVTVPASDTTTSFEFNPDWSASNFNLVNGGESDSGYLAPGTTYSVVENAKDGWDLTSVVCNSSKGGTEVNTAIVLDAGETVTCTFTNTQRGKILVDKVTDPAGSPVSFNFHLTGGPSNLSDNFALTDTDTPHDSGLIKPTTTQSTYAVSEDVPSAWLQGTTGCTGATSGASPVTAVVVAPGETVTCTFNNAIKRGSLTIVKQTNPDGASGSFDFTTTGSFLELFSPSLSDGQSATRSNLYPGTFSITETDPGVGWHVESIVCTSPTKGTKGSVDLPNRSVGLTLEPAEDLTCVFTNTKHGTIIVEKQTAPDGAAGSFTFTGDASGSISDGGQITVNNLAPGIYTSTETDPAPGFDLTGLTCDDGSSTRPSTFSLGTRTATFKLDAGETVKCTFTNTKRGSITVIKDAVPNDAQDFAFTLTGNDGATLDDDSDSTNSNTKTWDTLAPGSFTLAEVLPNAGWDLTDITCVTADASDTIAKSLANGTATIDLDAGESVTCTFTNTKRGHIIVRKVTVPASDTTTSFEFNPDWSASNFNLVNGGESDSGALAPGTYSVAELAKTGWDLTSATCSDESPVTAIVLGAGETVTCTFTNTQRGNIQVVKIDNTSAAIPGRPAQWNFTITGPNGFNEARSIPLGGGAATLITNVPLGNGYSAVETEAIAGTCPVPNPTATYRTTGPGGSQNLAAGQTITFTFTNTECGVVLSTGNLVINKVNDLNGNHVQDAGETRISGWNITVTGPQFPGGATFATDANGQVILPGIKTGAYTITEETRTSHTVIGVVADDNAPVFTSGGITASVNLAFADEDTVTFYNQPRSSIRVVKTQIVNGASGPGAGWTFTLTGCGITVPIVGVTGSDGVVVFTNLKPANGCSYTVTESVVGGWAVSPSISQAASPAAGQQATVNFTNSRFDVCLDCNPTPTPTPTKTPTPTATPTKTPTITPSPVNTVAGERTPGPQPTPSAPKTGEGIGGGVASLNTFIIVAGLIALSSGLFATGLARKRNNRR